MKNFVLHCMSFKIVNVSCHPLKKTFDLICHRKQHVKVLLVFHFISRDFEFPWHCIVATKEDSGINTCTAKVDVFMKLALELAEVGPKYVVSFLLSSLYCEEHPTR